VDDRALMAEHSTWDFDWTPPDYRGIDRPDVRAWSYMGGWAGSRGVGRARWPDDQVERHLPEIREFFAASGQPFRWYVGPSTQSRSLFRILSERSATMHEPRLMTVGLSEVHFRSNAGVAVRELVDPVQVSAVIDVAFPEFTTERRDIALAEKAGYLRAHRRGGELLSYMDGELVGFADWRDSSGGDCVQLVGAWTKPSHRGRGVYSTLAAHRCERARERGLHYASIVADPTTSGPIVARAGFADHGPLHIFSDVHL
jgi:GNAT superfamily N-acetyltransferase